MIELFLPILTFKPFKLQTLNTTLALCIASVLSLSHTHTLIFFSKAEIETITWETKSRHANSPETWNLISVYGTNLQKGPEPWLVWLSWLSAGLQSKGSLVRFLVRAHAWDVGWVPSGAHVRGNHTLMLLSFSFSLPSPLKKKEINKIFKNK